MASTPNILRFRLPIDGNAQAKAVNIPNDSTPLAPNCASDICQQAKEKRSIGLTVTVRVTRQEPGK